MPKDEIRVMGVDGAIGVLSSAFGRDLVDRPAIAMRQLVALSRYDALDRLIALAHIPTLVVSSEKDRIARRQARVLWPRRFHLLDSQRFQVAEMPRRRIGLLR